MYFIGILNTIEKQDTIKPFITMDIEFKMFYLTNFIYTRKIKLGN